MGALDLILEWAWILLAIAIGVLVLATITVVGGPVMDALERRFGGMIGRRVRTMAGRPLEAPPWVCGTCQSVNGAAVEACYGCQELRPPDAAILPVRGAADLYNAPPRANRFDPSRYRGPGAPQPVSAAAAPSAVDEDPGAPGANHEQRANHDA